MKKQGGYKPGGFFMREPACKMFSTLMGDVFTDMLEAAGADECPLPAVGII